MKTSHLISRGNKLAFVSVFNIQPTILSTVMNVEVWRGRRNYINNIF